MHFVFFAQTDLFGVVVSDLECGKLYTICPLSVMAANDKSGFALRWLKQTQARAKSGACLNMETQFVEKKIVALSARKDATQERKEYGRMPATLVAASNLCLRKGPTNFPLMMFGNCHTSPLLT